MMDRMNRTSRATGESVSRSQTAVSRFGSAVSSTSNRMNSFSTRMTGLRAGTSGLSASFSGMQSSLIGLMGAYAGVTGVAKLFNATIGAAANYEQNAMAISGMFGDDKQAKKYLQMVEKAAIDSPVLNSTDMMTNSKAFIGISKNLDELKQVWGLVERIQALSGVDTQQAAFSTKELMQGDYVSMYEAVGLDKKELQKITKMDGMSAKMAGLDKLLTKMGVNDEMVNNMANTTKGLWSQIEEKSQTFFRNMGTESNTKLGDFLRRINKMFDGLDTTSISNKLGGMLAKATDKAIALYDIFVKWRTQIAYVAGAIGTFVAALAVVGTISALANPVSLIAAGIAAAVVGFKALYDNSEMFRGAIDGIVGKVKSLWDAFKTGGTGGLISALFPPDIANQINSVVGGIKAKISGLMSAFKEGGFKGVLEMLISPEAISAMMSRFATTKEQVVGVVSSLVGSVLPVLQTLWSTAQPILSALWDALKIVADVVMLAWNNIIAPTITFVMKTFQLMWSVIGPILELLGAAIGTAFKVLRLVWDTIVGPFVAFLAGGFTQAFGAATEIVNALSPVFEKVGGWISTAAGYLREFTDILGKVKVPDWIGKIGSGAVSWAKKLIPGGGGEAAKSHYHGISDVPYDSYYARLHKGERVLTAQENKSYDQGSSSDGTSGGVVITGNNFTVREEADIEKIAYGLAKLIEEARFQRGR
ncbi:phage tail protein [Lysinibacillus fusiformis]|uniref:phage tail protein n=1 Tax=Lysinibacillus fusiformis TaxID=28031 RepID=UPI003CFBF614